MAQIWACTWKGRQKRSSKICLYYFGQNKTKLFFKTSRLSSNPVGGIRCRINTLTVHKLKQKCHHFDEIFITGCTVSCQNDNFQCRQWWKCDQNDNIFVSVITVNDWWLPHQYFWWISTDRYTFQVKSPCNLWDFEKSIVSQFPWATHIAIAKNWPKLFLWAYLTLISTIYSMEYSNLIATCSWVVCNIVI